MKIVALVLVALTGALGVVGEGNAPLSAPRVVLELPPSAGNPRNSEGDTIRLKDGGVLYIYSRYTKGSGADHDPADLVACRSADGGRTWKKDVATVVPNEGACNVMSVSLVRMANGDIGLFYLRKNSAEDNRVWLRRSSDEGLTWSAPHLCVPEPGYYVLNNCRVVRLKSGRLVLPLCRHEAKKGRISDWAGKLVCEISDDDGRTWRRAQEPFATFDTAGKRVTTQEPGVIELKDGRALMYARTRHGRQWFYYSSDNCQTWTKGEPGTLWGPCSPATITRLKSGALFAVWNDHETFPEYAKQGPGWASGTRRPLSVALSYDEGRTWVNRKVVEDLPKGWYCYFSVLELEDEILLSSCAEKCLRHSRLYRIPLKWLTGK